MNLSVLDCRTAKQDTFLHLQKRIKEEINIKDKTIKFFVIHGLIRDLCLW